jgi:hypothetical protein
MPAGPAPTPELLNELATALDRAKELVARVASQQQRTSLAEEAGSKIRDLEGRLEQRDRDRKS